MLIGIKFLQRMNNLLKEDVEEFSSAFPLKENLEGAKFLITGATGLIGSTLVRCLLGLKQNLIITCPVRNIGKANNLFGREDNLGFVECDLVDYLNRLDGDFDYIIHCASPTAGTYMKEHPVETFELAIESTRSLLNFAVKSKVKSIVYVSSLEYYGQITTDRIITEKEQGFIDPLSSRSSYPLGKRAAEYLCSSYAQEYGVNVKIARLTQTFGIGVSSNDNRVFAQFARSVIQGADIVMHTTGESAKPYCYTTDCVSAMLYILLKGENGEAYNVANPNTYISIRDMANFLQSQFNPKIQVRIELHPEMGYAPVTKLRLSADKLMSLGWLPRYNLRDMFDKLIKSMSYEN